MADREDVKAHARRLYAKLKTPWPATNRWSTHTQANIAELLRAHLVPGMLGPDNAILNVGSHGNGYGIDQPLHYQTDIVLEPISQLPLACVADAEALPFKNGCFGITICVGSVVNYCSAAEVISELARVTQKGGYLFIEFETSDSFEFWLTPEFSRDVTLVKTFYNGDMEDLYVYSKRYIEGALLANDFKPVSSTPFHVITPLVYRVFRHEQLAARCGLLDRMARKLPALRNFSANVFVVAQKLR